MTTDPALRARDKAWWTIRTALYAAGFSKGQRDEIEAAALAAAEAAPPTDEAIEASIADITERYGGAFDALAAHDAAEAAPLDDCDERMKAYRARRENLARRKYDEGREQGFRDAAEAAPLDVGRLARAIGTVVVYGNDLLLYADAEAIAREYAALRSPDTETAGEAT